MTATPRAIAADSSAVASLPAAAPSLVLVEGRRGGKPGLRIEPELLLCRADGSETEEYRRIYHRP